MSNRLHHRWLIWLLPLIVARAFVPAGFMVTFGVDGLELMLCSGSGPMDVATSIASHHPQSADVHAHHAHHAAAVVQEAVAEHTNPHEHDSSVSHENTPCPFAVTGTSSAAAAHFVVASWLPATSTIVAQNLAPRPHSIAVLIDRIRGPPLV